MKKRRKCSAMVALPILLSFACASVSIREDPNPEAWPEQEILAREMPTVRIETDARAYQPVKIVRLQGGELTVLPYPYWNVDLQKIDCGEIRMIQLLEKKSGATRFAASGFLGGFAISGLILAAASRYNNDFQAGLLGALVIGSAAGLLGLLVGVMTDSSSPRRWRLAGLAPRQRLQALMRIMGVRQ